MGKHATKALAVLAATVALLLVAYVGTYFALVERSPSTSNHHPYSIDHYRYLSSEQACMFFTPMYYLDRDYLRPAYWEQTREDLGLEDD